LLSDIIGALGGPTKALSMQETDALFERHRGNIREALRELYDRWAAGDFVTTR
jgi:hypothetical protein